jgi:hypothetical protein
VCVFLLSLKNTRRTNRQTNERTNKQGAFYIFKGKAGTRRGFKQKQARMHALDAKKVLNLPILLLTFNITNQTTNRPNNQPTKQTNKQTNKQGPVLAQNGGDNFARTLSLSGDGRVATLGSTSWASSQGAVWTYINWLWVEVAHALTCVAHVGFAWMWVIDRLGVVDSVLADRSIDCWVIGFRQGEGGDLGGERAILMAWGTAAPCLWFSRIHHLHDTAGKANGLGWGSELEMEIGWNGCKRRVLSAQKEKKNCRCWEQLNQRPPSHSITKTHPASGGSFIQREIDPDGEKVQEEANDKVIWGSIRFACLTKLLLRSFGWGRGRAHTHAQILAYEQNNIATKAK